MTLRDEKLKELVREMAAEYFLRESNRQSLITVTDVRIESRGHKATLLISVMPEEQEDAAVSFMHRQLTKFRQYVMKRAKLMHVPYFEVAIDKGEKNRQRLDDIAKTR